MPRAIRGEVPAAGLHMHFIASLGRCKRVVYFAVAPIGVTV